MPGMQKFGDNKRENYSPSTTYGHGQGRGQGVQHRDRDSGNEQSPRRRVDRYRREVFSINEKLLKQNDTIIQLLKEIRDRLPARGGIAMIDPLEVPPEISIDPADLSLEDDIDK
jgi:hypothetical protein